MGDPLPRPGHLPPGPLAGASWLPRSPPNAGWAITLQSGRWRAESSGC